MMGGAESSFMAPDSTYHMGNLNLFFSHCRNSPPYSVSLPNYVEELSFSFPYVNVLNQLC